MTKIFLMSAAPCTYLSNPWKSMKLNLKKTIWKRYFLTDEVPVWIWNKIMPDRTMIFRTGIVNCPFMNKKPGTIKGISYTVDNFSLFFKFCDTTTFQNDVRESKTAILNYSRYETNLQKKNIFKMLRKRLHTKWLQISNPAFLRCFKGTRSRDGLEFCWHA